MESGPYVSLHDEFYTHWCQRAQKDYRLNSKDYRNARVARTDADHDTSVRRYQDDVDEADRASRPILWVRTNTIACGIQTVNSIPCLSFWM